MVKSDDPLSNVIEEVEIEAPDMDTIHSSDHLPAQPVKASTPSTAPKVAADAPAAPKVAAGAPAMPKVAAGTTARAVAESGAAVSQTLPPPVASRSAATFFEDAEVAMPPARSKEQPVDLTLPQEGRELPAALADISDLAPPAREVEFTEVEGEDDLDLNLDLDLGFDLQDLQEMEEDTALPEAQPEPIAAGPRKSPAGSVDMDSDLDFELDLGGLSLRDYETHRK